MCCKKFFVLFKKPVLQEGRCTIHKACVARRLLYYSQRLCCKKASVLFTKPVLQVGCICRKRAAVYFGKYLLQESSCTILKVSVAKRTAFNIQKPYVARDLLDNWEASTFCCKRVVALFGKLSLQEACFHTQEASIAREYSIAFFRTACCVNRYCTIQKVFVTRGLLFSSESACCKRVAVQS
jgi:hypothetical protein